MAHMEAETGNPITTTEVTPDMAHEHMDPLAIADDKTEHHTNKTASH